MHSFARTSLPRATYPRRQTDNEYYACQFLDPAIQACFRLLGSDGPPLVLVLDLKDRGIPGTRINLGRSGGNIGLPDLPDFVESLRQEFSRRIDVIWKDIARKDLFTKQVEKIQDMGWGIVAIKEQEQTRRAPLGLPLPPPLLVIHFTLRRKVTETVQIPPTFCESCYIQHAAAPLRLPARIINFPQPYVV